METAPIGQTGGIAPSEAEDQWMQRERKLTENVNRAIAYYRASARSARVWHRIFSTTSMVLTVLSPVFVVSNGASESGEGIFGIDAGELSTVAVSLTVSLAIVEGIRRIYKFDQRWSTCYMTGRTLKKAREDYRFGRIGLETGSDEWQKNLLRFRSVYEDATDTESREFFEVVKSAGVAASNAGGSTVH